MERLECRALLSGTPPTVVDVAVASTEWSSAFYSHLNPGGSGIDGYSIPVGSAAQMAPLPWMNLDQISVRFSEDVHVDITDLALSGISTPTYAIESFRYDPYTRIATWTLEGALPAGRFMIDINGDGMGPVTDLDGQILDGEWTNGSSTYASGNGTAGGDFEFRFNVLPGDVDSSTNVTYWDYYGVYLKLGLSSTDSQYVAQYDLNGSGAIDSTDLQLVYDRLYSSYPSGTPIGVNDDAPSTAGFELVDIDDHSIDVAVSLYDVFDDAEDGSSGLSYSIVSNSAASLFDSVSINHQTGDVVLNTAALATGRAAIIIQAVDSSGQSVQSTLWVDVNRDNLAPYLFLNTYTVGADTWIIEGHVTDADDDVDGWFVWVAGVVDRRVVVDQNGYFEFAVILDPEVWGIEWGWTFDPHGVRSNVADAEIGIT